MALSSAAVADSGMLKDLLGKMDYRVSHRIKFKECVTRHTGSQQNHSPLLHHSLALLSATPMCAIKSQTRLLYPHSLSYQDTNCRTKRKTSSLALSRHTMQQTATAHVSASVNQAKQLIKQCADDSTKLQLHCVVEALSCTMSIKAGPQAAMLGCSIGLDACT